MAKHRYRRNEGQHGSNFGRPFRFANNRVAKSDDEKLREDFDNIHSLPTRDIRALMKLNGSFVQMKRPDMIRILREIYRANKTIRRIKTYRKSKAKKLTKE